MQIQFKYLEKYNPAKLFKNVQTPCYILDEAAFIKNCEILKGLQDETGVKVLLAEKAFSNFTLFPLLSQYIAGTEASGLFEARLGREEMPDKEVHVFSAAYRDEDFREVLKYADHIIFNSIYQLKKFGPLAKKAGKEIGLRVNPECSTQEGHAIYDPCSPGSRLGVTREVFDAEMDKKTFSLLSGLHFHTLCEQDSDALETTVNAFFQKFGDVVKDLKWLNLGGGHHITRPGYDLPRLKRILNDIQKKYSLRLYLEPGEAVALNAGYLATRVLDIVKNSGHNIAILDMSAACHTPDVIEMPYQPPLMGADPISDYSPEKGLQSTSASSSASDTQAGCDDGGFSEAMHQVFGDSLGSAITDVLDPNEAIVYRLAGPSCLAGDVVGDYSFNHCLKRDELLVFGDMAIYSICKNNTFNGIPLPSIYLLQKDGSLKLIKSFSYEDFKGRLG